MKKKISKIVLLSVGALLLTASAFYAFNSENPFRRQPTVFYSPIIYPLETVKGDVIYFDDDSYIIIDKNKRINSIRRNPGSFTINATIHVSLWDFITK